MKLSFLKIFFIFFLLFFIWLNFIETLFLNYLPLDSVSTSDSLWMAEDKSGSSNPIPESNPNPEPKPNPEPNPKPNPEPNPNPEPKPKPKSNSNKAGDAGIMAVAIAGAAKIAAQTSTPQGKVAVLAGGLALGASGIIAKNVASNMSSDLGKPKNFIPADLTNFLNDMFELTGNNGIDLLNIIYFFQKLQLLFLIIIIYNFFLVNINEVKLEKLLVKILPLNLVKLYIRSLIYFKKSSFIILLCLLILLAISNYLSYYYLGFYIENLDSIVNFYFKK